MRVNPIPLVAGTIADAALVRSRCVPVCKDRVKEPRGSSALAKDLIIALVAALAMA